MRNYLGLYKSALLRECLCFLKKQRGPGVSLKAVRYSMLDGRLCDLVLAVKRRDLFPTVASCLDCSTCKAGLSCVASAARQGVLRNDSSGGAAHRRVALAGDTWAAMRGPSWLSALHSAQCRPWCHPYRPDHVSPEPRLELPRQAMAPRPQIWEDGANERYNIAWASAADVEAS